MPSFPIHTIETAPDGSKAALADATKQFGFLPNLMGELAAAPAALKAYLMLGDLLSQTSLSPAEQQIVLVSASMSNDCHYCVAAHSAGLTMAGMAAHHIEALRAGRPLDDPRLDAIRVFTATVVEQRGDIDEEDVRRFIDAGYTQAQVLEVLVGVAMKTLSNYTNHIAATPLDPALQKFAWEPAADRRVATKG